MNQQTEGKEVETMCLICCYRCYQQLKDTLISAQVCCWVTVPDEHVVGSVHSHNRWLFLTQKTESSNRNCIMKLFLLLLPFRSFGLACIHDDQQKKKKKNLKTAYFLSAVKNKHWMSF